MGPITRASVRSIPLAYASCSIGSSSDTLPRKLQAISKAGFTSIELSFPDILEYAEHLQGKHISSDSFSELVNVSDAIRDLCQANSLTIMMLQPFTNFEGWPRGTAERENAFATARAWIEIMKVLGTDMLQVGATDIPPDKISTTREAVVSDLRELADMLAKHNFRLAYENWCWSTHAPGWKDAWEIVSAVDRPNIGLCLDTFQIAGSEWADPTTESGVIEEVPYGVLRENFAASMDELARTIPPEKIYLLQISDAYRMSPPLTTEPIEGLRPRGQWSHDYRPMPYDGGYLPIEDVAKAVLKTGFRGWFSMEIFDSGPDGTGKKYEIKAYAKKAMESMQKLLMNCTDE
ncbi:hypothetical protein N7517_000796 [Penicillium concentricum]|uniref:Xylose isomerase-like TIM barrel domain-containing protein n=1 Tax=Penicillium concentricum TaxID=293559 RepID=A0A9W9VKJ9_9EURO|nr:uncharacterized protein N7517_000796 [Penicillium concentricum]KAJ5382885.1 hypothetical protein N7517_000796 [Penicillium concentricum]